jgi:hypothetical protein
MNIEFLAHAPPIPDWFERLVWYEKVVEDVPGKPGYKHEVTKKMFEPQMDHLVRWRFAYSKAMQAEYSKQINENFFKKST